MDPLGLHIKLASCHQHGIRDANFQGFFQVAHFRALAFDMFWNDNNLLHVIFIFISIFIHYIIKVS